MVQCERGPVRPFCPKVGTEGHGADKGRLVRLVRARISAENARYGGASADCGALFRSEFACFSDGEWNSVCAPMRQCLSDAALFQLTIERKGHRNRRTGGLL
jgi:hypothetical protein